MAWCTSSIRATATGRATRCMSRPSVAAYGEGRLWAGDALARPQHSSEPRLECPSDLSQRSRHKPGVGACELAETPRGWLAHMTIPRRTGAAVVPRFAFGVHHQTATRMYRWWSPPGAGTATVPVATSVSGGWLLGIAVSPSTARCGERAGATTGPEPPNLARLAR